MYHFTYFQVEKKIRKRKNRQGGASVGRVRDESSLKLPPILFLRAFLGIDSICRIFPGVTVQAPSASGRAHNRGQRCYFGREESEKMCYREYLVITNGRIDRTRYSTLR